MREPSDGLIERWLADLPAGFDRDRFAEVYRQAWLETARDATALREPAYRLRHGHRVARLGLQLLQAPEVAAPSSADAEVVWLGGLLHDVTKSGIGGDPPGEDHAATGAQWVRRHLSRLWPSRRVDHIAEVVYLHNKRRLPASLEARAVQDADLLDHFGALEIWLAAYAAAGKTEALEECLDYLTGAKNRRWRQYALGHAYLEATRRLLEERLDTADRIIRRLEQEAAANLRLDPL
ncbi:MAG TPA: HD domain-containing protein [Bacillota bacterium]